MLTGAIKLNLITQVINDIDVYHISVVRLRDNGQRQTVLSGKYPKRTQTQNSGGRRGCAFLAQAKYIWDGRVMQHHCQLPCSRFDVSRSRCVRYQEEKGRALRAEFKTRGRNRLTLRRYWPRAMNYNLYYFYYFVDLPVSRFGGTRACAVSLRRVAEIEITGPFPLRPCSG